MKKIELKFTSGEFAMVEEAKSLYLNKQGVDIQEANIIPVEAWIHNLIWTITENLCERPKGHAAKKKLPT